MQKRNIFLKNISKKFTYKFKLLKIKSEIKLTDEQVKSIHNIANNIAYSTCYGATYQIARAVYYEIGSNVRLVESYWERDRIVVRIFK